MGRKVLFDLCRTEEQFKNMTVRQLKEKIGEIFPEIGEEDLWLKAVQLVFLSKTLDEDDDLLSDYGIHDLSVIHMVIKVCGGGEPIDENSGMGDKTGKNRSMESLRFSF